MRTSILIAVLLLAALSLSCGHGADISVSPGSFPSSDFSLRVERLDGSGRLAAEIGGTEASPSVVVTAEDASALKGAYFYVDFPGECYHPQKVEFGDFLGGEDETLTLAVTTQADEVPLAITQIHPDSATGASGSGMLARVYFASGAAASVKSASQVPGGSENAVKDLTLVPTATEGQYFLTWHEINIGDYNNDSTVGIQDITPLAVRFGESVGDGDPNDSWDDLIDGNGDGVINIQDITPIAAHFGNSLAGYKILKNDNPTPLPNLSLPTSPLSILRPTDYEAKERVEYAYGAIVVDDGDEYRVAACDASGEMGVLSEPAIFTSGGAPEIPTGLAATYGVAIGVGNVYLTWSANSESDLLGYHLFRRPEGVTEFEQIVALAASSTHYTDTGLESGNYEYAISAYNTLMQESELSEPVSAAPFYYPPPDPPTNLQALNTGIDEGSIKLTWTASESTTVDHYEIHRQAPGEADFSPLTEVPDSATQYLDEGLTIGETYSYKLRAVDSWGAIGEFTEPVSTTPSEEPPTPVTITSIATDRYTFNPGENAEAHLSVTVDPPGTPVSWDSGGVGSFPGGTSGTSVTWKPEGISGAQGVLVTATADDGSTQDSESITLVATEMSKLGGGALGDDFTLPSRDAPNQPYLSLHDYTDDHMVVLLDLGHYT